MNTTNVGAALYIKNPTIISQQNNSMVYFINSYLILVKIRSNKLILKTGKMVYKFDLKLF